MITLVRFWADWCGPCQTMKSFMDELKNERSHEVVFTDVDVSSNPGLVQEHHVRSIPTLLVFNKGQEIGRNIGAMTKEQLEEWLDGFIRPVQPDVLSEQSAGS